MAAVVRRHERTLLRVARQASLCHDDALDAYQRALEIFVRRVDTVDPATEVAWLKVVVRHEAMAIRRARSEAVADEDLDLDSLVPGVERSVDEQIASSERVRRSAEALRALKPDEAKALMMKAHGLSYEEIGERNGWSYANVTATLALFVALGGSSYAAVNLPRNSVGSTELKTNSVGAAEIKRKAVRSSEISDRSIRLRDISTSARSALHGQTGPAGPPGPTFFETVDSAGGRSSKGNAAGSASSGVGVRSHRVLPIDRELRAVGDPHLRAGRPDTQLRPSGAQIRTETTVDGRALVQDVRPERKPDVVWVQPGRGLLRGCKTSQSARYERCV